LKSTKIALIAILSALSISTNYALIGVSNVKLMDFIVFFGGFCFGAVVGSSVGVLSWFVYGLINPLGPAPPLIWIATMLAESVYGIAGGFIGKKLNSNSIQNERLSAGVFFATLGFLPTVLYDLVTNVAFAYSMNVPMIGAIVTGAWFGVVHEASNAAIFGLCTVPLISVMKKSMLRQENVLSKE
jgi:uncharacterized membrane protein